eukprot:TRINITY_DN18670_c0_g2_i1.p1 TRINITY_DN18670_c0_g2~~TRINITY_DN18670_c0_g2_i1.p1  ORF type:complete len:265 (-),score=84.72 TRINITY_DN18670_c0_g2_i1:65-859(-)
MKNYAHDQIKMLSESTFHKELTRRMEVVAKLRHMIFESEDWGVVSNKSGVKIQYNAEPELSTYSFKISALVRAPLFNLIAVVYEVDLYGNWMPRLKYARELALLSKFQKIVQLEINSVWPIANRDSVIEGFGVDFTQEDALLVVIQSVGDYVQVEVPEPEESVVRATLNIGAFYIKYISEEETQIYMILNFDPKLPVIPDWVLNFATGQVLQWIFYFMEKAAKFDDSSPYAEKIRTNPVYDHARRIIERRKTERWSASPKDPAS